MPTIIDELLIKIGIDPKGVTEGQKKTSEALKKVKQDAREAGKEVDGGAAAMVGTFTKVTGAVLALGAAFLSLSALKQVVLDQAKLNAETSRTANAFGTATETLSKWRNIAVLAGSTAGAMTGSIRNLIIEFQKLEKTGASDIVPLFRSLPGGGVDVIDQRTGKFKKWEEVILDLADSFQKMNAEERLFYGSQLGFDDAFIAQLGKGRAAIEAVRKDAALLGVVTDKDAKAGEQLAISLARMETAATSLGRVFATAVSPWVAKFIDQLTTMLIKAREFIAFATGNSGAAPATGGGDTSALRVKPGAGSFSVGTASLARAIQNDIPGIKQFTAANDDYHGGGGAHGRGEALDFTLKDPNTSAETAAAVRRYLADRGVGGKVFNEYLHPSSKATGGHLHVQFNSADDARKFSDLSAANGNTTNTNSSVQIGTINVNAPNATDADGVAKGMAGALRQNNLAVNGNHAQN